MGEKKIFLSKLIYRFDAIPIKILEGFFVEYGTHKKENMKLHKYVVWY